MKTTDKTVKSNAPMPYFAIERDDEEQVANVYIFGDIASKRGGLGKLLQPSSDQSSYDLAKQLSYLPEDCSVIVHINSNGGELKEGLGIYNVLKDRANVTTICEGFAASAASLIFCAGSTRIMQPASLLFIHQALMSAYGNSDDFEKAADDLRIVTNAAIAAYKECGITIDDDELMTLLKKETWITPEEAVRMGFATQIAEEDEDDDEEENVIKNDAMKSIMAALTEPKAKKPEIIPVELEVNDQGFIDVIKRFTDALEDSEGLFALANKALNAIDKDPEIINKLKVFADMVLATNTSPIPARVEHKGFFNFGKAE